MAKKKTTKKAAARKSRKIQKKAPRKVKRRTNKRGVKNSLVNNINARKKKGISRPKKKSTVTKKQYKKMKKNWI